jgi:hypothetical protein
MRSLLQHGLEREIQHDKLVAELSKHIGNSDADPQHIAELASLLEPFLRSIFRALEVAAKFAKDPQCGRAITFTTGQVVQYCFDEDDLFPEHEYGILGLLDDAYLVHKFAGMLHQMYPHVELGGTTYQPPDERTLQLVCAMLPPGVCDALDRTCFNLLQVANALFTSAPRESNAPLESLATLRIQEAISILTRRMNK